MKVVINPAGTKARDNDNASLISVLRHGSPKQAQPCERAWVILPLASDLCLADQ